MTDSPSVRNLVKNFEGKTSPWSPRRTSSNNRQSHLYDGSISSSSTKDVASARNEVPAVQMSLGVTGVGEKSKHGWDQDAIAKPSVERLRETEKSDETIPTPIPRKHVISIAENRKLLIDGLKLSLSGHKLPSETKANAKKELSKDTDSIAKDRKIKFDGLKPSLNGKKLAPDTSETKANAKKESGEDIDSIAENRKMLIDGLKLSLNGKKLTSETKANVKRMSSIGIIKSEAREGTKTDKTELMASSTSQYRVKQSTHGINLDGNLEVKETATFTIPRRSISSMPSPVHTPQRSNNSESFIASIVSHCHSAESEESPMKQHKETPVIISSTNNARDYDTRDHSPLILDHHSANPKSELKTISIDTVDQIDEEQQRCFKESPDKSKSNLPEKIKDIWEHQLSCLVKLNHLLNAKLRTNYQNLALITSNTRKCFGRVPKAAKVSLKCIVEEAQMGSTASFVSLILSMASNIYPTTPRCNVGLPVITMFYCSIQIEQSKYVYCCIIALFVFSFGLDIDWIISDYYPITLTLVDDPLMYNTKEGISLSKSFVRYMIMINIFVKTVSITIMMLGSEVGSHMVSSAWERIRFFIPPMSVEKPENLSTVLKARIIAVVWVEIVSASLIFAVVTYIQFRLSWAPQFKVKPFLITLPSILLAKALCGVLLVIALMKRIDKQSLFSVFGCCGTKPSLNSNNYHKVVIDKSFLRFNGCIKSCSSVIGFLAWYTLMSTSTGNDNPKEIKITIGLLITAMALTDLLAVTLWLTIVCYACIFDNPTTMIGEEGNTRHLHKDISQRYNNSFHTFLRKTSESPGISLSPDIGKLKISSTPPFTLSENVICNPTQFSHEWKQSGPGVRFNGEASRIPTIDECNWMFQHHRFFPVASGVVDGGCVMTCFLIAEYKYYAPSSVQSEACMYGLDGGSIGGTSTSPTILSSACLCKISFKPIKMSLVLELKLRNGSRSNLPMHSPVYTGSNRSLNASSPSDFRIDTRCDINVHDLVEKMPLEMLFGASKVHMVRR